MSLENAKRFMDVVSKDQALQQRFAALNPRRWLASPSRQAPSAGSPLRQRSSWRVSVRFRTAVLSSTMIASKASPVASGFLPVKPRRDDG